MPDEVSPQDASRVALDVFRVRHGAAQGADVRAGPAARVVRLDQAGGAYFLVPLRDAVGLRGIVQIDARTGREEISAAIKDPASGFLLSAPAAREAARKARPQVREWGETHLGWLPSPESFDSMRPLWVVNHADGAVYVDQSGHVFDELTASGRGG